MPLVPLKLPAGFYRNGTDFDASNRWRDGSLVRWRDGSLRPIGGWQERKASFSTNPIRGAHAWETNNNTAYFAGGSHNELKVMTGAGTVTDITPSGLATGREDAEQNLGYGGGFYGTGYYGTTRPSTGTYSEASSVSLDNFGEELLAIFYDDGRLFRWDLNPSNNAAVVAGAPTNNLGLVVTEERFVVCLGAGGNPRKLQWSDKEDLSTWTPAATNEAGDILLQTSGQIMQGIKTRGQTLILTDLDTHVMRYIGPPYVYSVSRVSTASGAVSRMSAVDTDMGAFWMGQRGFFRFDGNKVQELPCEVHDYVFDDLNVSQISKVYAVHNSQHGEIWWFYPSGTSNENDRYVTLDYKEGHWSTGELDRTAGVDQVVVSNPIWADASGNLYNQETGYTHGATKPFAESGSISLGNGDSIMKVTQLIPDEKTQGQVEVTFKTRFYPNDSETSHGAFTLGNPTDVRFQGRQVRIKVQGTGNDNWRSGVMRIEANPGGRR